MTKPVTIRSAQKKDVPDIWHLLHSDGKSVSMESLTKNPENFYVLLHGTKLLSVYSDSLHAIDRPTVHPLYPQKLLEKIMTNVVNELFLNRREDSDHS